MKEYRVTVKHDHGRTILRINADNEEHAKKRICDIELCPERAIIKVKEIKNGHKGNI